MLYYIDELKKISLYQIIKINIFSRICYFFFNFLNQNYRV